MKRAFFSLAIVAGMIAAPAIASAAPLSERLAAFNASLSAMPCATDSDCEARALSFGIDPELLSAIFDCENGDETACDYVDENTN